MQIQDLRSSVLLFPGLVVYLCFQLPLQHPEAVHLQCFFEIVKKFNSLQGAYAPLTKHCYLECLVRLKDDKCAKRRGTLAP